MTELPRLLPEAPHQDPRHSRFLSRDVIATSPRVKKIWTCGPVLNQGQDGGCMGYAWAGEVMARPKGDVHATARDGNAYGDSHNRRGQELGSVEDAAVERGIITEYRWATNLDDFTDALHHGPILIYVPWYRSMFNTYSDGRIKVTPHTNPGFHATLIHGYDPHRRLSDRKTGAAYRVRNSWGASWGRRGDGWLRDTDLDRILSVNGYEHSACVPIGRQPVTVKELLATYGG